jgi:hypothetical protein
MDVKMSLAQKIVALQGIGILEDVVVQPYGEWMGHGLGFVGVVASVNVEGGVEILLT